MPQRDQRLTSAIDCTHLVEGKYEARQQQLQRCGVCSIVERPQQKHAAHASRGRLHQYSHQRHHEHDCWRRQAAYDVVPLRQIQSALSFRHAAYW